MTLRGRQLVMLGVCVCCLTAASGWATRNHARAEDRGVKSCFPFLLRDPSINKGQIAFTYAQDIWIARRDGSGLRRLTTDGHNVKPVLSPDGSRLVFTRGFTPGYAGGDRAGGPGDRSGGLYVMTISTGEIRQLTYHPSDLFAIGWSRDGKQLVFASRRAAFSEDVVQLFSIPSTGGFATRLPLPRALEGSLSPDGSHIAYVPNIQFEPQWKHYRGGQTTPIWIVNLADSNVDARIPRENSNDSNPMWVGENIYFLSDRNGPVSLFSYNVKSHQVEPVINNDGFDIKSAAATDDSIVYEQFGSLHMLDLRTRREHRLDWRPTGDFPEAQPHFVTIKLPEVQFAGLSPDGDRALMAAHGDIFTISADQGSVRNLTETADVDERDPAWSPDGRSIAYLSDESGEYLLHVRDLSNGAIRKLSLGDAPAIYSSLTWSPDSTKIGYTDQHLNYWYVDVGSGTSVRVDTDLFHEPIGPRLQMAWSPDGRWLGYTKQLSNHLHAAFVFSIEEKKGHQVTDGMTDVLHVAFDRNGKYLYFTASADLGLAAGSLNLSALQHPVVRNVYALILRHNDPSPLVQQGEEKGEAGTSILVAGAKVTIDLHDLARRIIRLPITPGNYYDLAAGTTGKIYLTEGPVVEPLSGAVQVATIREFDLAWRKDSELLHDVVVFPEDGHYDSSLRVSFDGRKLLYASHGKWAIVDAGGAADGKGRGLLLNGLSIRVEPRAEWRHMFYQVFRAERDRFYDPNLHGLDTEATARRYAPFLENLGSREDFSYLIAEVLSNMSVGHMWIYNLEQLSAATERPNVGLLGADYFVAHGRYRFERIYDGDTWEASVHSPLSQPGAQIQAGEYLLSINGREILSNADLYSHFVGTAGRETLLRVGPSPGEAGSRELRVTPVNDEMPLRQFAWLEDNRLKVDRLTSGRVAYVYLTDTSGRGLESFNRNYFAQVGKDAAIIDERYGGGGPLGDYFVDYVNRPVRMYLHPNSGNDVAEPEETIWGPKVLLINEMQGSGADLFPSMFRQAGIGPLIGKRTWGGAIGASRGIQLLDGTYVGAPNLAYYTPDGAWIENHGVTPDIDVEDDPRAEREGHDPQLEKAVTVIMDSLQRNPPASAPGHPAFPNYRDSAREH